MLQCVLLTGIDSSVLVITSSTCASLIDRGAPGRGSSSNPSSRFTRKRSRHLQTVAPVMCNFLAAVAVAQSLGTRRARSEPAWRSLAPTSGDAPSIANFSFSSAVTLSGFVGRPMAIPQVCAHPAALFNVFLTQDTSSSFHKSE